MPSNTTTTTSSDSSNNTEVMHQYTSLFDKDHVLASHFLECLEHVAKSSQVDGFDLEKVWTLFDKQSVEDRRKHIKTKALKAKRDAVVTVDNFQPEGVKKPAVPREMFRARFKLEQAKAGKEYKEAEFKEAWENIAAKDREALEAERAKLQEEYEAERQRQLDDAIAKGEVSEKRPKPLPNAFFLYKEQVTANPSRYLKPAEVKKFEGMKSTEQTKLLSDKYKLMKANNTSEYQELQKEIEGMVPLYTAEVYEWKVRSAKRLLNRAERLGEDVEKYQTELLNLENNPPEDYKPTSKNATDVPLPGAAPAPTKATGKSKSGKGKGKK